jgi:hypothetical protein
MTAERPAKLTALGFARESLFGNMSRVLAEREAEKEDEAASAAMGATAMAVQTTVPSSALTRAACALSHPAKLGVNINFPWPLC